MADNRKHWQESMKAVINCGFLKVAAIYKALYRYASLKDGDTFWEMPRKAILSLCKPWSVLTQTLIL
jgi:hypothetical protein